MVAASQALAVQPRLRIFLLTVGVAGLSIGEFKEGATIAYHQIAEKYAAAGGYAVLRAVFSEYPFSM